MGKDSRLNWWTRRTDAPPYEIVGPLERIDQRDYISDYIRRLVALEPGTPAYEAYFAAHPDKLDIYHRFRRYPTTKAFERQKQAAVYRKYPFATALSFTMEVGEPEVMPAENPISPQRLVLDPQVASRNIKKVARLFGADMVGICELNPAWVLTHNSRGEPVELKHRYAIVSAVAFDFNLTVASRGVSKAALDIEYKRNQNITQIIGPILASYIRNLGYAAHHHGKRASGWLIEQAVAVDAGLGEVGRNSLLITKEFGAAVMLTVVTTDMPLAVDKPVDLGIRDFCAKCLKCARCCPTNSIPYGDMEVIRGVKKWGFNGESCLRPRLAVGNTHWCGRCVTVCPWTKPRNVIHRTAAELVIHLPFTRRPFIWLDDFLYGKKPRSQPLPDWLEPSKRYGWKQRIITALLKS